MLLSDLPPEILGQILHFQDVSHQFLNLWQCGSRLLTAKLAAGITYVDLAGENNLPNLFPRALCELHGLRYLSFKSTGNTARSLYKSISKLSSTLEELHVLHLDASKVFLNHGLDSTDKKPSYIVSNYGRGDTHLVDISLLFPRLHTLELFDSTLMGASTKNILDLAGLPSSITSFSGDPIFLMDDSICVPALLPPSLRRLESEVRCELYNNSDFLASWATHLPELESAHLVCYSFSDNADWMPRSLTGGTYGPNGFGKFTPAIASSLPPMFASLELTSINIDAFKKENQHWPSELPKNLTTLTLNLGALPKATSDVDLQICNQIALLPRSITHLAFGETNMSWDLATSADLKWPFSLVSLSLQSTTVHLKHLKLLPKSLTRLHVKLMPPGTESKLAIDANDFSPNLTDLTLTSSCSTYTLQIDNELPQSLTKLIINSWTHAKGLNLESFKRFQTLKNLVHLKAFITLGELEDAEDASEMPLPPHLTNLALNAWNARWFSSIPRSVTVLNVQRIIDCDSCLGSFLHDLPSDLVDLELALQPFLMSAPPRFPEGSLPQLPHLRRLNIHSLGIFGSSTMRCLPHLLRTLVMRFESIDECDAPFFPQRLVTIQLDIKQGIKEHLAHHWPLRNLTCPSEISKIHNERRYKETSRLLSQYHD